MTTDANGEATIKITLGTEAVVGTIYTYYVETEDGCEAEASMQATTTTIPEFPIAFLSVGLMFLSLFVRSKNNKLGTIY